jgi:hexosaminidase
LFLHATSDITAAAFNKNGRESEEITGKFVKTGLLPATSVTNIQPGLRYTYYEGRYRKVPEFKNEKALKTGITGELDIISPRDTADAYGLMFEGYISVPEDGVYTFYLTSDDGSRLVIGDHVTALSDGLHEMEEASGQEALQAGLHHFRLEYFDYGSDEGLSLFVSINGKERVPVDRNWFFHN